MQSPRMWKYKSKERQCHSIQNVSTGTFRTCRIAVSPLRTWHGLGWPYRAEMLSRTNVACDSILRSWTSRAKKAEIPCTIKHLITNLFFMRSFQPVYAIFVLPLWQAPVGSTRPGESQYKPGGHDKHQELFSDSLWLFHVPEGQGCFIPL